MDVSNATVEVSLGGEESLLREELHRLRKELEQFELFFEELPDAMLVIDLRTNRVVSLNHTATIVLGYTMEDVEQGIHANWLAPPAEARRMQDLSREYIISGLAKGGGRYQRSETYNALETRLIRKDGSEFHADVNASYVLDANEMPQLMRAIIRDISVRVAQEEAHKETIRQLEAAMQEVRTLRGLIPMCAWCHKIRDDQGYWQQLEKFLRANSNADITHSICEPCSEKLLANTSYAGGLRPTEDAQPAGGSL